MESSRPVPYDRRDALTRVRHLRWRALAGAFGEQLKGERFGLYGIEFGLALFAISNIVIFVTLIWWNTCAAA